MPVLPPPRFPGRVGSNRLAAWFLIEHRWTFYYLSSWLGAASLVISLV